MNKYERYGEYSQQSNEGGTGSGTAIKYLLIGVGIGAAAALLFSPISGREVREAITRGCRFAFDGISQQTRNLRDRGSNLLGFNRKKAAGEYDQGTGI
jgi:gas vesicle protein